MKTVRADALVIVDIQRAFVTGPDAIPDASRVSAGVGVLLARARQAGSLVIHLQNDGPPGALDEVNTPGWMLASQPRADEPVIRKRVDDGFVGTDLEQVLRGHAASTLVLCGVQSEMCVAATARGALARHLTVILPRDSHGAYPIPGEGAHGLAVPGPEVARVAEWSLGDEVVVVDTSDGVAFSRPGTP